MMWKNSTERGRDHFVKRLINFLTPKTGILFALFFFVPEDTRQMTQWLRKFLYQKKNILTNNTIIPLWGLFLVFVLILLFILPSMCHVWYVILFIAQKISLFLSNDLTLKSFMPEKSVNPNKRAASRSNIPIVFGIFNSHQGVLVGGVFIFCTTSCCCWWVTKYFINVLSHFKGRSIGWLLDRYNFSLDFFRSFFLFPPGELQFIWDLLWSSVLQQFVFIVI